MKENRSEQRRPNDPLTGEEAIPASTGISSAAMATAGAAVGGLGAMAAGATAGSAAGPIGAAIGGIIGALIGGTLERNVEHRSNPPILDKDEPGKAQPHVDARPFESGTAAINIRDLSSEQQRALLDLVVLAMYADGHVASAEERRVNRLLELLGHTSDYDRNLEHDASIARTRAHLQTPEGAAAHATELINRFHSDSEKKLATEVLQDFLGSDGRIGPDETRLLLAVTDQQF